MIVLLLLLDIRRYTRRETGLRFECLSAERQLDFYLPLGESITRC